jgi:hypothetical protein
MLATILSDSNDGSTQWEWRLSLDADRKIRVVGVWARRKDPETGLWDYPTIDVVPDIPHDVIQRAKEQFCFVPVIFDAEHFQRFQAGASGRAANGRVVLDYTNHRGERSIRTVMPLTIKFGPTEHHPEPQWILEAWDLEKAAHRSFPMKDIRSFTQAPRDVGEGPAIKP